MSLTKFEKDPTEKGLFDKIQEIIETILSFATVAKTGSYNDLTDKPTVPGEQIQSDWNQTTTTAKDYIKNKPTIPDAQVNSDWNAVSGKAQILNKPTLFSGSYNDLTNKPTIPAAQIQSDWAQTITTALDYIKNKPTLFSGNYNDLTNKPTIPSAVTESTVSDWGFTKNAGTVTKVNNISPVNGNVTLSIPAAQIQADWNQTTASALDYIKNKPTLFSGSYNDLTDKPTIPSAVTESTVSGWGFTKFNGSYTSLTNVPSSFTPSAHNQASSTINALTSYSKSLSGGTGALSTSDTLNKALAKLENALDGKQASGNYLTGITSSMVTTALGYTPYNSTNPNGYQANVIETIKVNNVAQTVTSKTVNITVPSAVTESTVSGWGFTKNTGTVTSVNNVSPVNGNVSLTIPTDTQDTCGASNTTSKIYLVGRTAQSTGTSNSNSSVYVENGYLYAKTPSASSNTTSVATTAWVTAKGYTTNVGTVTKVNNTSPDANGNVSLTIPTYNFYGDPFYSTDGDTTGITKACDSLTANGHYYYTSGGPSGLGEQSTDGAVYVQGYNDNWVTQIAQDYRTGNLFVRSRNNGTWVSWKAIANKSDIPDTSSFVSKSGDTMTGDLYFSNCSTAILTPATKGTNPSEAIWRGIAFNDNTNDSEYANTRLGILEYNLDTSGGSHIYLRAYKNDKTVTTNASLELAVDSSGNASCLVNVTPADNDNSKKIATTEFVKKAALGNYVNVNSSLISTSASLKGTSNLPYTLSLPSDGKKYLCLIWAEMQVTATSGKNANIKVGSDICSQHSICKGVTRTNATFTASGATWVPVSSTHKIYISRASDWEGSMVALVFGGYMRMGENS